MGKNKVKSINNENVRQLNPRSESDDVKTLDSAVHEHVVFNGKKAEIVMWDYMNVMLRIREDNSNTAISLEELADKKIETLESNIKLYK